ncbi:MAG TPA: 16S rRNA (cytosine(967)-C(5))-methyltransferase RsmB [Gammaproteobacteria bacterium]|nr:16S rRNA (cytosine(967)-C(5))-methyltransferase RsmB [Gammaproteobacteria bacterium]
MPAISGPASCWTVSGTVTAEVASAPRAVAARILREVCEEGRSLGAALTRHGAGHGLVQELCYGTLRWLPRLQWLLDRLLRRPLKAKDAEVRWLLLAGLYQLLYMRIPPHAAVMETVAATRALEREWLKGLVNGVLRNFLRRREALLAACEEDEAACHAHPPWLIRMLREAWPSRWEAVLAANNQRPPMVLRVNRRMQDRAAYLRRLEEAGLAARPLVHAADGVVLETPVDVHRLPGFAQGAVSVQDGAAQLAAGLLDLRPGLRVLDACAAPGGKTCHLLETEPALAEVVAVDIDPARCARIEENLQRLQLEATVTCGDAAEPGQWWDARPFDRILLDAPCTATGVIRRHPDIKCLRRAGDVERLAAQQARLLRALWPLLKGGGMLLYATCSVLPRENSGQVRAFLAENGDAVPLPMTVAWGLTQPAGRQVLPGEDDMDGFYYACIGKRECP